jgi:putative endonuclease
MTTDATTDTRRRLGALGERLAREHLARAGYRLVQANFRCRHGELDLVVADARALVFCEVKTRIAGSRAGPAGPLDAIGPAKQRRLRVLAREWLHAHPDRRPHAPALRFDAIGVTVTARGELLALDHVEDAF